jgi:hypothetical protein
VKNQQMQQLFIQFPEEGNVMTKHVGATIHNKLNEQLVYLLAVMHIFTGDFTI